MSSAVDFLRRGGWRVAVHNDYTMNGELFTFWLWTKGERAIKGEGRTDEAALAEVLVKIGDSDPALNAIGAHQEEDPGSHQNTWAIRIREPAAGSWNFTWRVNSQYFTIAADRDNVGEAEAMQQCVFMARMFVKALRSIGVAVTKDNVSVPTEDLEREILG
jgi:hypothetical protein